MKLAISSSSFASPLLHGELTQLEWLEHSASTLGADGVVFEFAHFPRTDPEYTAQLKKVAVDLGLVPLAIDVPALLDPATADEARERAIAVAGALGALFAIVRLPPPGDVPPAAFVAAVGAGKTAVRAAKRANVTILVEPAAGTLAPDPAAARHFSKDVDSAWLRYAVAAGADRRGFGARDRALVVTVAPGDDLDALDELADDARPWLLLRGNADAARITALRTASAKKTLAFTNVPLG